MRRVPVERGRDGAEVQPALGEAEEGVLAGDARDRSAAAAASDPESGPCVQLSGRGPRTPTAQCVCCLLLCVCLLLAVPITKLFVVELLQYSSTKMEKCTVGGQL